MARCAVERSRLAVCVVDIVHGPNLAISRGAAFFYVDPSKFRKSCSDGGRLPFVKLGQLQDGQTWDGTAELALCRPGQALHDFTPKEHRQVRTANVLLVYAIAFATLSAVYGIANWTEHLDLITRHAWLSAP